MHPTRRVLLDAKDARARYWRGLDLPAAKRGGISQGVLHQAELAISEADLVLFLIDGREGLMPEDREVADRLELKPRQAFQPVRVAVTGSKVSPGLFESIELLGRETTLSRLRAAGAGAT